MNDDCMNDFHHVSCRLRCKSQSFLGDNKTGTAAAALGCKMEF